MNRYFEVADKVINGEKQTRFDPQQEKPVIVKWDVSLDDIPNFSDGKKYVKIKAAEDLVVPSIWKAFVGVANTGINAFTNKLNSLLGSGTNTEYNADYNEPFRPVPIHTGVKVNMPDDEMLFIHSLPDCKSGVTISGGTQLVTDNDEIIVYVYNTFPSDIRIAKGQEIALGIFQKVSTNTNVNPEVNLNK